MTCCFLHNYLRKQNAASYVQPQCIDNEDLDEETITTGLRTDPSVTHDLQYRPTRNAGEEARNVCQAFMHYFNNEGQVYWQDKMILLSKNEQLF